MGEIKEVRQIPSKVKIVSEKNKEEPKKEEGGKKFMEVRASDLGAGFTPDASPLMSNAPRAALERAVTPVEPRTNRGQQETEVDEAEARPYETARRRENEQRRYQSQEQARGPTMRTVNTDSSDNPLLRRGVGMAHQAGTQERGDDGRGYELAENALTEDKKMEHKRKRDWF